MDLKIVKNHMNLTEKVNCNDENLPKNTQDQYDKLLRTIKPSENMAALNCQLPRAKY